MVSKSHHWLHKLQLATEHSLKGATNYGKATGVGTKHAVLDFRSRDQDLDLEEMNSSALESRDHGLEITTLDVVYEDYHHDTSSSSSLSNLFRQLGPYHSIYTKTQNTETFYKT